MLAEQIQQRGLDRGDGVDGRAQVISLHSAAAGIAVRKFQPHGFQDRVELADRPADDHRTGVLDGLPDALPAG